MFDSRLLIWLKPPNLYCRHQWHFELATSSPVLLMLTKLDFSPVFRTYWSKCQLEPSSGLLFPLLTRCLPPVRSRALAIISRSFPNHQASIAYQTFLLSNFGI